ncbi:MAG: 3'-5' exonuclease [Cetobacterium sp.]
MKYLYLLDFEANCTETNEFPRYEMEIIEFPIIILDIDKNAIIDEFHTYVKPVKHPLLTEFCKELTKINQNQVDNGILFKDALINAAEFISKYPDGCFVTCGNWDLDIALTNQITMANINTKDIANFKYFRSWINIHEKFKRIYKTYNRGIKKVSGSAITKMLTHLNLTFEGTLHSGIDDTRNIARIVQEMINQGINFRKAFKHYLT